MTSQRHDDVTYGPLENEGNTKPRLPSRKTMTLSLIELETVLKNRVTDRVSGSDPVIRFQC